MVIKTMKEFVLYLRGMTTSELITNFPLSFHNPVWTGNSSDTAKQFLANDAILWKFTGEYAKFLCPKLEIWMFVPCDDLGNIMVEPERTEENQYDWECYLEGKSKCLFEGIEITLVKASDHDHVEEDFYGVTCNGQWCGGWDHWISSYLNGNDTVEGLTKLKEELRPTISKKGRSDIGLWGGV